MRLHRLRSSAWLQAWAGCRPQLCTRLPLRRSRCRSLADETSGPACVFDCSRSIECNRALACLHCGARRCNACTKAARRPLIEFVIACVSPLLTRCAVTVDRFAHLELSALSASALLSRPCPDRWLELLRLSSRHERVLRQRSPPPAIRSLVPPVWC